MPEIMTKCEIIKNHCLQVLGVGATVCNLYYVIKLNPELGSLYQNFIAIPYTNPSNKKKNFSEFSVNKYFSVSSLYFERSGCLHL